MSSNIIIDKKCDYCNQIFQAKTLVTRYCSNICNSRDYKKKQREERINEHIQKDKKLKNNVVNISSIPILEKKYLNMKETAIYIGVSLRTIERLVSLNKIPFARFQRRVLINRTELDKIK